MATTSKTRQLERLSKASATYRADAERRIKSLEIELEETIKKLKYADGHIVVLKHEVNLERGHRIAAQRSLVNYMRDAGLGDRIGYDPDQDPQIIQDIADGKLPPCRKKPTVREVMALDLKAES